MRVALLRRRLRQVAPDAGAEWRAIGERQTAAARHGAVRRRHPLPPSRAGGVLRPDLRRRRLRRLRLVSQGAGACGRPADGGPENPVDGGPDRTELGRRSHHRRVAWPRHRPDHQPAAPAAEHLRPARRRADRRAAWVSRPADRAATTPAHRRTVSGAAADRRRRGGAQGPRDHRALSTAASGPRRAQTPGGGRPAVWDGVDRGLFETLRQCRTEVAHARGVPPYVVFHDNTLRDLARRRPTTTAELLEVYGIGARKAEDLGPIILEVIRDYRGEPDLEEPDG